MKGYKKVSSFVLISLATCLLFFSQFIQMPTQVHAKTNEKRQSCAVNRGTDTIFVVQDTKEMLGLDIASNPQSEETYISESIEYLKTFNENTYEDRAGVIGFNTGAVEHAALTSNFYTVENALNDLADGTSHTRGGNDLSTGVEQALKAFQANDTGNQKTMVILTTGVSINNEKTLQLAREAYEKGVTIHIFGIGGAMDIDGDMLTRIAEGTGGNYYHITRASTMQNGFSQLKYNVTDFEGRVISSDWKLTKNVVEPSGLLIDDNVTVDLNGYSLTVNGEVYLQPCAELRAVDEGVITAESINQRSGSLILLNNSQLKVNGKFTQDGDLRVNGPYKSGQAEVDVDTYNQRIRGSIDLNKQALHVNKHFEQEGTVNLGGGTATVLGNLTQKGKFKIQKGKLFVEGNLFIQGGPLLDDAFKENRSLDVGGGFVQVGSAESMETTREKGNIRQTAGQLYVNHGAVHVFGDYTVAGGWLTMIEGSMDTVTSDYGEGDGDYVHVRGDFTTSTARNHAERRYTHITEPSNDPAHLTDGVLKIDGQFTQIGNREFNEKTSDRSYDYTNDFSRYNFHAAGRHKVVLTNQQAISVDSREFTFQHLELNGQLTDYQLNGSVKWKNLIQRKKEADATLRSLTINGIGVVGFNPNKASYPRHAVPATTSPTVSVFAKANDQNATVEVHNKGIVNNQANVMIIVTAADGKTKMTYTVGVQVGGGDDGRVTALEFDQKHFSFVRENSTTIKPNNATIRYTVKPNNAHNQRVLWRSTDESVASVRDGIITPVGLGEATIIGETEDGQLSDSATVEVLPPHTLTEGIKTLSDLVSDEDRYNKVTSLYGLDKVGIIVPGKYLKRLTFDSVNDIVTGKIEVDDSVKKIGVRISSGEELPLTNSVNNVYTFSRLGLTVNDYVEVTAYNAAGNELERIFTFYPVDYEASTVIPPGYHSLANLVNNPATFDEILGMYSLDELKVEFH